MQCRIPFRHKQFTLTSLEYTERRSLRMGVCGLAHGARREEKKILHFPVTSGLSPSQPKQAKRIGKVPLLLKWRRRAPIPLPFFSLGAFRAGGKRREGNKGGALFLPLGPFICEFRRRSSSSDDVGGLLLPPVTSFN